MERKAHMNIHDTVEVKEEEGVGDTNYTRDRFGKKHKIDYTDSQK